MPVHRPGVFAPAVSGVAVGLTADALDIRLVVGCLLAFSAGVVWGVMVCIFAHDEITGRRRGRA